jgi:hypothetical protein
VADRSLSALALGAAALVVTSGAMAVTSGAAKPAPTYNCFFPNQWRGWSSPDPSTLYLKVNIHDVYRVDLANQTPELQWPSNHLIAKFNGTNVCQAIDLDLSVAQGVGGQLGDGFRVPLIALKLTKLTPDEVAAIPPKFRP